MWVEGFGTFRVQIITKEISAIFTRVLNHIKSSCIIFYAKTSWYFHWTNCLQKVLIFDQRVSIHFGLDLSGQFGIENHKWNISNVDKYLLNYSNFSCRTLYVHLSQNSYFTHYLHNNLTDLILLTPTDLFLPSTH